MKQKTLKTVTAIAIAVAAIVICALFSRITAADAASEKIFSLIGDRNGTGSATVSAGDSCLTIVTPPVKSGFDILCYTAETASGVDILADAHGIFYENVLGYTDSSGSFAPAVTYHELYPIWYSMTESDGMSIFLTDDMSYIGSGITVSYEWFDGGGQSVGQTSSINRTDCYCVVTLKSSKNTRRFTLPEISSYNIAYELSGGNFISGYTPPLVYADEDVVLPAKTDVFSLGYTFIGWYDNIGLTGDPVTVILAGESGNRVYYAKWKPDEYSVTLYPGEGTIAEKLDDYTYGIGAVLPKAEQSGYRFEGWFDNDGLTGAPVVEIFADDIGNKVFYAGWSVETYNIDYILDGGVFESDYPDTYTFGEPVTLPQNIVKTGHQFCGWYDNAELTGMEVKDIANGVYGEKTYYAKWEPESYTIEYEPYGGSLNGAVYTYVYGDVFALPTDISKTGQEFLGWYEDAGFSGEAVLGITVNDTGYRKFYAKWEPKSYTVNYVHGRGAINDYAPTSYTYGKNTALPRDVTCPGYQFLGWYDNEDFSGDAIESIPGLQTGDVTFYAGWLLVGYNIIYDPSGGSFSGDYISAYTPGETVTLPENIIKAGYDFAGWYDNKNFEGNPIKTFIAGDDGDLTFYARWTTGKYDITYITNGGVIVDRGALTYTYGDTVILPEISKTGHTFCGWYEDEDFSGTAVPEIKGSDYGNMIFYAKWTANIYCISFFTDGGIISGDAPSYTYGIPETLPVNVDRAGFIFQGWYDNPGFKGSAITLTNIDDIGDLVYYAKWTAESYSLTFITNGGSFIMPAPESYIYGEGFILPENINRDGFTFIGWYETIDFSGSAAAYISTDSSGDKIYYAKWSIDWEVSEIAGGKTAYDGFILLYFEVKTGTDTNTVFQWYKDGKVFSGETSSSCLITEVADSGSYYCMAYITANGADVVILQSNTVYAVITPKKLSAPTVTFNVSTETFYIAAEKGASVTVSTEDNTEIWTEGYIAAGAGAYRFIVLGAGNYADSDATVVTLVHLTLNGSQGFDITAHQGSNDLSDAALVEKGSLITVNITVQDSHIKSIESLVLTYGGAEYGGKITGNSVLFTFTASSSGEITATGLSLNKYQIALSQGTGYILTASEDTVMHGGNCEITFAVAYGFYGGEIYVDGTRRILSGGKITVDVTSDITVSVTGIMLDEKLIQISSDSSGVYNGKAYYASALSIAGLDLTYAWYLGFDTENPVSTDHGNNSVFAVTAAGAYDITLVITLKGNNAVFITRRLSLIIEKENINETDARLEDGRIILTTPPAASGTSGVEKYLYLDGVEWRESGDSFAVASGGTYTFMAKGDINHNDSKPFSVVINTVTLVSEGEIVKTLLAASGIFVINETAEKQRGVDVVYKFAGWYDGELPYDGYVYGDMTLTAVFNEYLKTVTSSGLSVSIEDGFAPDTVISITEAAENATELLKDTAGSGILVHAVDISVSSVIAGGNGVYTVSYTLPDSLWGKSLAVYHYAADGTVEKLTSFVSGGSIVFTTAGFSPFGFFDVTQYTLRGIDEEGNNYFLGTYTAGDEVLLTAAVHPTEAGFNYVFDGWFTGDNMSTRLTSVTIDGDSLFYARFIKTAVIVYHNVTAVDEDGNVYFIGAYASGSIVDLSEYKITRGGLYVFEGLYSENGDEIETLTITGDRALWARFTINGDSGQPDPVIIYNRLTGMYNGTEYDLYFYEKDTILSLTMFSLPSYEADGHLYIFEGWYADAGLTLKLDSVKMTDDTVIYANFIQVSASLYQSDDDGELPWTVIMVISGIVVVLLVVLVLIVLGKRRKPKTIPAIQSTTAVYTASDQVLARAEQNFAYIRGEIENAESYLGTSPDRDKSRALTKVKGLLKEYEYILQGMRAYSGNPEPGEENSFAEASLDRLMYEITSAISGEIFA